MRDIRYIVDDADKKTAVILDLRRHGTLWKDIHDRLLIESRRTEPRGSLQEVRCVANVTG